MASLESIRKRSGLLIGFIGLALAAFVLQDLFSGGGSLFSGNQSVMAKVNGESIDQKDFEIELQSRAALQAPGTDQAELRASLWNEKIESIILNEEYENTGISVSADELTFSMTGYEGHEIDPFVKQLFQIPPGQDITADQLSNFLTNMKTNDRRRYNYAVKLITNQRLRTKLSTLVSQSYFASETEAKRYYQNQSRTAAGQFVYKSYSSVAQENKTADEADLLAYYNKNKDKFKSEASRQVEYAVFEVQPSNTDNQATMAELIKLKSTQIEFNEKFKVNDTIQGFETTTEMNAFLREHSDLPFNPMYFAKGQLDMRIDSMMHSKDIGYVYGPYFELGQYKMVRLMDRRNDSVQVAMFSREVVPSEETDEEAFTKAGNFAVELEKNGFETAKQTLTTERSYAPFITMNMTTIPGVGNDMQIKNWAFSQKREIGDLTRFSIDDNYIVVRLVSKNEKGYQNFEQVKEQIRPQANQEKAKAYLANLAQGSSSLEDAASKLGVEIKDFSNVSLAGNTVTGLGYDPIAVGAIMGLEANQVSGVVTGTSGVMIAKVTSFNEAPESNDYEAIKSQISNGFIPRVSQELVPALRDHADIEDLRGNFY
ncbi:MAG: peptidylprolyl isomerase [Flavobacteriales bacterium]